MSAPIPERILDQLQANLGAAGIPATSDDIEGILAKGFLARVAALDDLIAQLPSDTIPDMLRDTAEASAASQPDTAPTQPAAPSGEIGALAAELRARRISPVELVEQSLAAIERDDPQLNAFQLVLGERARAAARRAEQELASGHDRGPLHGVPVAVKDLLDLAGTPTTAGSRILAGRIASADSFAVERLEAAGAVIVGKTRMSEFAYSPGSNNGHYGPTRNPHNHAHDAGGSSSGSAASVAAGIVYAALGSDTGGSIRIPAALCGVVGLKPTYGRISLHGAVTLSWSLDHLGPLTRTVADAALLLDVLAGHDPRDTRTRPAAAPAALATVENGVRRLRVGVLRDDGSGAALASPAGLAAWRAGLDALASAGAELVEVDIPEFEQLRTVQGVVIAIEAATFHEPWLRERLDDYGEFMRQRVLSSYAYGSRAFVQGQQARAVLRRRCMALFERVDLISTPSQPGVAPELSVPASTALTNPFNQLGWPAISVPVGRDSAGLPFGMQIAGRPWDDALVLRAARVVEQAGLMGGG
jgi:aspartyl-tRNA(Asn)/glutamyl-tRNA(Gln) amidotransferase subunit A